MSDVERKCGRVEPRGCRRSVNHRQWSIRRQADVEDRGRAREQTNGSGTKRWAYWLLGPRRNMAVIIAEPRNFGVSVFFRGLALRELEKLAAVGAPYVSAPAAR